MQEKLLKEYDQKYTADQRKRPEKPDIIYKQPEGSDEHVLHHTNFFDGIRMGKPIFEDAAFGFRAAAPCIACNDSYFEKKIIKWDAEAMKIKS